MVVQHVGQLLADGNVLVDAQLDVLAELLVDLFAVVVVLGQLGFLWMISSTLFCCSILILRGRSS